MERRVEMQWQSQGGETWLLWSSAVDPLYVAEKRMTPVRFHVLPDTLQSLLLASMTV